MAEQEFRFRSLTFYGAPLCERPSDLQADVAFLGVPFDLGTTLRPGARFGPLAIRTASGWWPYVSDDGAKAGGWYDLDLGRWILQGVTMADCGDVEIAPVEIAINLDRISAAVAGILRAGSFPVIIGGDHAITFPVIRAFGERGPLHIAHFDAHQDFVDERRGTRLGHGNALRRASELPFVKQITQIGIRGLQKYQEPLDAARAYGVGVITASELRRQGAQSVADAIPKGATCYLSVDIDALDMALAPGTGTPEPGGLTYVELREAIRAIARRGRVVGLDLVEVSPAYDWAEVTARSAARLILDVLAGVFADGSLRKAAVGTTTSDSTGRGAG